MNNQARSLMLLAVEAHANSKFDTAGTLFTAAMASADLPEFIAGLTRDEEQPGEPVGEATAGDGRPSMSQIANSVALAMAADEDGDDGVATASDDEDEDEEESDGEEDEEDEEDSDEDEEEDAGSDEDDGLAEGDDTPSSISSLSAAGPDDVDTSESSEGKVKLGSVTKGKYTLTITKDRLNSRDAKFFVNEVLVLHGSADLAQDWLDGTTEEKLKNAYKRAVKLQRMLAESSESSGPRVVISMATASPIKLKQ